MRVNEAVGRFLKRYRAEHELTMDDVATASRRYGSGWSSGTISQMERGGSKADSVPVLLLLVQSLNYLTGDTLTVPDLFRCMAGDAAEVSITDTVSLSPDDLATALTSGGVPLTPGEAGTNGRPPFEHSAAAWFLKSLNGPRPVPTAAEIRAAKKTGIDPHVLAAWCRCHYGRTLDGEASRRAGDGASPQKRGRVTRVIVSEIKVAMLSIFRTADNETKH